VKYDPLFASFAHPCGDGTNPDRARKNLAEVGTIVVELANSATNTTTMEQTISCKRNETQYRMLIGIVLS
jgi:hypothetical protein